MQRYIPVDPSKLHDIHINLSRLLSFNQCRIFGCVGARGYGKTYWFKRLITKDFIYDNIKHVVIRDTIEACEKVAEDGGHKFFGDIFSTEKCLKNHTYNIQGTTITIDDKLAGEIIPMSAYYKYKGNYYDADDILFDEFIQESVQAYRGNRARQFANTIETIIRARPKARVFMTANALDLGNDILEMLDIHIKNGQFGYYINEEKKVVIYYAPDSEEFKRMKANSISGIITKGTFLDANLNRNEFEDAGCILFEKRKPCNIYGIYYNNENECFRLYKSNSANEYYVCKDINANSYSYMRYVFNAKQISANRKYANQDIRKFLSGILFNKQVKFESQYLFGVYCSIVNNTLKK